MKELDTLIIWGAALLLAVILGGIIPWLLS
jgi:hypothetical protein